MDKAELIEVEERICRRNAEIARQLRSEESLKCIQKFAKLLAKILAVRR